MPICVQSEVHGAFKEEYGLILVHVLRDEKCRNAKDNTGCLCGFYTATPEETPLIPEQQLGIIRDAIRESVKGASCFVAIHNMYTVTMAMPFLPLPKYESCTFTSSGKHLCQSS